MKTLKDRLAGKSHVIWDWNGTIIDDVDLCIDIIGAIALRHGLPAVSKDDYLKKFRFPVCDYYQDIGLTDAVVHHKEVSKQFVSSYAQRLGEIQLHPGMAQMLMDLHQNGVKQSLLSAAHEVDLRRLLVHFQLSHLFTFVFGLNNHDAHSKIERGHDLIQHIKEPLDQIVMIGDTLHDREVAEELGIDIILLSGGHQHPEILNSWPPIFHLRLP